MSISPDKNPEQRRYDVLQRAPFLSTFLNTTYRKLDPDKWAADLKTHRDEVLEKMTRQLGPNWEKLTITPLLVVADQFKIFNPEIPGQSQISSAWLMITDVVAAGYEIGNLYDAFLFSINVAAILDVEGFFKQGYFLNREDRVKAINFTSSLLVTGAGIRQIPPQL